jgi:hypothetical protein
LAQLLLVSEFSLLARNAPVGIKEHKRILT